MLLHCKESHYSGDKYKPDIERLAYTCSKLLGNGYERGSATCAKFSELSKMVFGDNLPCLILFFYKVLKAKTQLARIDQI